MVSAVWLVTSAIQILVSSLSRDNRWFGHVYTAALAACSYLAGGIFVASRVGEDLGIGFYYGSWLWLYGIYDALGRIALCD